MAGIRTVRCVAVASAFLLAAGVAVGASASSSAARTITFEVRVDRNLNGANWLLTTHDDAAQVHTLHLREGIVRDWRKPVRATIRMALAKRSTSNFFALTFFKLVDRTHAFRATATVGLTRDHLLAGGVVDLGKRTGRLTKVTPCPRSGCPRG